MCAPVSLAAPAAVPVNGPVNGPATGAPAAVIVTVDEAYAGQRLDNFLVRVCRGVPKSHVYQLIRSGQVRVNGGRATADRRLGAGDRVRVPPIRTDARGLKLPGDVAEPLRGAGGGAMAPGPSLSVIHQDEDLIVLDKPAGLAVHGGSGVSLGAIEALRRQRPESRFLELAHRLDRETSGLLLVACRRSALLHLQQQFRDRRTEKYYLAVVAGRWPLRTRTLDQALLRLPAPNGDRRVVVSAEGREAITRATGLARFELPEVGEASLVLARIETGRTHQIRVHLAHAGCPILGDDKYGNFEINRQIGKQGHRRMFLHAFRLVIAGCQSGLMRFEAPMPPGFVQLLALGGLDADALLRAPSLVGAGAGRVTVEVADV